MIVLGDVYVPDNFNNCLFALGFVWAEIKCQSERLNTRILKLAVKQLVARWAIRNVTRTEGNIDEQDKRSIKSVFAAGY